jgi:hypothetical protein
MLSSVALRIKVRIDQGSPYTFAKALGQLAQLRQEQRKQRRRKPRKK